MYLFLYSAFYFYTKLDITKVFMHLPDSRLVMHHAVASAVCLIAS